MVLPGPLPRLSLVSGPASGGKSRWAEHLAKASTLPVVYLATGPLLPHDPSWQQRLECHRRRRPPDWRCWEVGGELAGALQRVGPGQVALVDSLGTWVSAHLECQLDAWPALCTALLEGLDRCHSPVLMVVEECGWGVVPSTAAGGLFRQRLGEIQQQLGQKAGASWLVWQGRALDLHKHGQAVPAED
jgi:adenosylcobinamide kinase/adenosylcobinamide-phosphate guanylyltransferase